MFQICSSFSLYFLLPLHSLNHFDSAYRVLFFFFYRKQKLIFTLVFYSHPSFSVSLAPPSLFMPNQRFQILNMHEFFFKKIMIFFFYIQIETPTHAEAKRDRSCAESTWTGYLPPWTPRRKREFRLRTAPSLAWVENVAREKNRTAKNTTWTEPVPAESATKKTLKPQGKNLDSPKTNPLSSKKASKNTTPSTP